MDIFCLSAGFEKIILSHITCSFKWCVCVGGVRERPIWVLVFIVDHK